MGWLPGKEILLLLLGCCYVLGASAAPMNRGFNLLLDPGFEDPAYDFTSNEGRISGTIADKFSDNTDWAGDEVQLSYSLDTAQPRSGSKAQCVTVSKGFAQVAQWIELPTGKSYTITLWVKVTGGSGSQVPVQLGLRKMQPDYDMYADTGSVSVSSSAGWVQLRVPPVELPASASDTDTLSVGFIFWVRGPGTACFDEGTLYESVDVPDDAYKLQNPSFEDGFFDFNSAPADIRGTMANGGWYDNTEWSPGSSLRYQVVNNQAQSGSQSIAIQVLSSFAQFTQWKTVQVGTAYRLTIWARGVADKKGSSAAEDSSGAPSVADEASAATAAPAADAAAASELNAASTAAAADTAEEPATVEASAAAMQTAGMSVTLSMRLLGPPYTTYASASTTVGSQWVQLTVPIAVVPWNGAGTAGQALQVGFMIYIGGKGTVWLDSANLEIVQDLPAITVTTVPKTRITRSYLGMNINHMHDFGREYTWPAVDFGWFRTWDSGLVWPYIQKDGPNSWDWTWMDKDMAQVKARQQKVLFTLGQTPTWASSEPDKPNIYGYGFGSVPSNIEDWKRFVRELLKRYGSWIAAVEVWNEPNIQGSEGFYNGTPEQLAALALATQQVLKELGHKAMLVNPPMAGLAADAVAFLTRYFVECRRLGVVHMAVAWHSYNVPPENDLLSMSVLRKVMVDNGLPVSLPIYNTEAGILPGDFAIYDNSHVWGAGFLARTYVVNWAAGVTTLYWYAYDAYTMEGLTMSAQEQQQADKLNDAGRAYINVLAALTNARMLSLGRNSAGTWTAALLKGTSSKSWIVWNGDQRVASKQVPVPSGAKTRQDLITGVKTSLRRAQQIVVTDVPVLLLP